MMIDIFIFYMIDYMILIFQKIILCDGFSIYLLHKISIKINILPYFGLLHQVCCEVSLMDFSYKKLAVLYLQIKLVLIEKNKVKNNISIFVETDSSQISFLSIQLYFDSGYLSFISSFLELLFLLLEDYFTGRVSSRSFWAI